MQIREDGTIVKRTIVDADDAAIRALRAVFGEAYDINDGNPVVDAVKAHGLLGVLAQEDEMASAYLANTLDGASGSRLDSLFAVIGGGKRGVASASVGTVNIVLGTGLAAPSPLFAIGDVYFVDAAGNPYDLIANVTPNSTTSVSASTQSRGTGAKFNIAINSIVAVRFLNSTVESFWRANVVSFTNAAAFLGGADAEVDAPYRARGRREEASNRSGSAPGIEQALRDFANVRFVRVYANNDPYNGGQENTITTPGAATTDSELINSAGGAGVVTKIAVKVPITTEAQRRFLQFFNAVFHVTSGTLTFEVRIESDSSGSPSGSLLMPRYDLTSWIPTDGVQTAGTFLRGDYPFARGGTPVTAWLVFSSSAGQGKLKGDNSGSAGGVKIYKDAAWSNSANINAAAANVIGGIPVGGYRAVVLGGVANTIAQVLNDWQPVGAALDGSSTGTAVLDNVNVTIPYEAATQQQLDVSVTIVVNALFQGNANTVKDIIVAYIGGTDTTGTAQDGLNIGDVYYNDAAKANFFDASQIVGVKKITFLKVALHGGTVLEQDLTPLNAVQFRVDPANITVVINSM